jgi:hypothetical protein
MSERDDSGRALRPAIAHGGLVAAVRATDMAISTVRKRSTEARDGVKPPSPRLRLWSSETMPAQRCRRAPKTLRSGGLSWARAKAAATLADPLTRRLLATH